MNSRASIASCHHCLSFHLPPYALYAHAALMMSVHAFMSFTTSHRLFLNLHGLDLVSALLFLCVFVFISIPLQLPFPNAWQPYLIFGMRLFLFQT